SACRNRSARGPASTGRLPVVGLRSRRELRRVGRPGEGGRGMDRKEHRRPGALIEVEVVDEIPEDLLVLAHVRPWVRSAVGCRIEALPVEEVVLDELVVRVKAQDLVVDV